MTALIAKYNVFAAPIANRVVGHITGDITRTTNAVPASRPLATSIAEGQLIAEPATPAAGTQIAFMNPGGIRADLAVRVQHPVREPATSLRRDVHRPALRQHRRHQDPHRAARSSTCSSSSSTSAGGSRTLILQVSAGFTYTWRRARRSTARSATIMLNGSRGQPCRHVPRDGQQLPRRRRRRLPCFQAGHSEQTGLDDLVALEQYLAAHDPYTPLSDTGSRESPDFVPEARGSQPQP